jgi:rod shape determining protein RodA
MIGAVIALIPGALAIMQSETGLALVYFSFFIVMYREGLASQLLTIGFSAVVLIIASILINPNTLAIILSVLAVLIIFSLRRQIKRRREILVSIVLIWGLSVGIQRLAVPFIFQHILQKHQVERIYDLFGKDNPYADGKSSTIPADQKKKKETGSSYNVRQSKIAIGSGGFWGKGLLSATQTRYDFVPEQRTDFIFCTIGEGFGFVGSIVLLGLYLILLLKIINIAERQRSTFSRVFAYSVASVFFFHIVVNVCMTIGLAPVIGIPLPMISYGGTSLLTFAMLLFILVRLDADRQMVLR